MCCIPLTRSGGRDMPGWTEQVEPEWDWSLFWHWMWCELGKPNKGIVYDVIKRARHRYHYAVRCCKKQNFDIQKRK